MRAPGAQREARFARLFAETHGDLLAYALRRARSPEDAADVLAETFLVAWRRLDSLPPSPESRLWLFGVARNVLRRGASRERANSAIVERLARELCDAVAAAQPAEREPSPELWSALQALPEAQREVLLLTAWEELTPREIAAVTGAPVNLVRVRLHRARARLKQDLLAAGNAARPIGRSSVPSPGQIRRAAPVAATVDSPPPRATWAPSSPPMRR